MEDKRKYDLIKSDLPYPLSRYAGALGIEGLIKLSETAGGKTIYIPQKENLLNYALPRLIKADREKGLSIKEIEQKYQIVPSTIYKKLKT